MIETQTATPKRYQCRHIFTDGRRCGSPCLRGEDLCYYHHTTRRSVADSHTRRTRRSTFELPLPEDRSAIQHSIGQVLQRIAANDIDPRRAGLLLYGLQIASLNLPKEQPTTESAPETANQIVEEITTHPELGLLAPPAEVGHAVERKSTIGLLLEKMQRNEAAAKESAMNETAAQSAILPALQATGEALAPQICIDQTEFHVYRSHRRDFRGAGALGLTQPHHRPQRLIPRILHHPKGTSLMKRVLILCAAAAIALAVTACNDTDTHDADVKAVQANESQWNQDWLAKDSNKIVAHYADDAVLMTPDMPADHGITDVSAAIKQMVADPALNLKFQSSKIEVAKSGDIGYTQGIYTMTMTDPVTKKVISDHGSYVTTYRKQPDGTWKAVVDIATSEVAPPPAPPAGAKHKTRAKPSGKTSKTKSKHK